MVCFAKEQNYKTLVLVKGFYFSFFSESNEK